MELPRCVRCIGGCVPAFLAALAFDIIGLVLLFVGIFANVRLDGLFYGDFLIYTGSLIVFFSLGFWLVWYMGNVPAPSEDRGSAWDSGSSSLVRLARKLSERLSVKWGNGVATAGGGGGGGGGGDEDERESQVSSLPAHKASRVTWGRSTAYQNEGYDDSMDYPPSEEKMKEKEEEEEMEEKDGGGDEEDVKDVKEEEKEEKLDIFSSA